MFDHIKKRIIKGLIEEITCLDATGIELIGHQYISIREGLLRTKGSESMRKLINDMLHDSFSVPLRVSLAAFARLRSYKEVTQEISLKCEKVEKLASIIVMSALEGLDQFYEAYVSFTSMFGYNHSTICVSIAEAIPEMSGMQLNQVERRQWNSACESLTNSSIAAEREGKSDLSCKLRIRHEIKSETDLSLYPISALGKVLCRLTTRRFPRLELE